MDLLPPHARRRLALVQLQAQALEIGLAGGQARGRRRLLGPEGLDRRHGRAPIRVQGQKSPLRQRQALGAQALDQALVAAGLRRLAAQGLDLLFRLHDDVVDPQQVRLRRLELHLGLPPLALVPQDPRGLLEHGAPVLGPGRQDLVNLSLLDGGVQPRSDVGLLQQVLDVLQPAALAVEDVLAVARAVDAAGDHHFFRDILDAGDRQPGRRDLPFGRDRDRHLMIVPCRPGRRQRRGRFEVAFAPVAGVVPVPAVMSVAGIAAVASRNKIFEVQGDFRHAERAAPLAAVEDHVLHPVAAQGAGLLLTEHPGNGVADVALATAVRADHGGDPVREVEPRAAIERLEAEDFHPVELENAGHQSPAAEGRGGASKAGILAHGGIHRPEISQMLGPRRPDAHDIGSGGRAARFFSIPGITRNRAGPSGRRAPRRGRTTAGRSGPAGRRRPPGPASSRACGRGATAR